MHLFQFWIQLELKSISVDWIFEFQISTNKYQMIESWVEGQEDSHHFKKSKKKERKKTKTKTILEFWFWLFIGFWLIRGGIGWEIENISNTKKNTKGIFGYYVTIHYYYYYLEPGVVYSLYCEHHALCPMSRPFTKMCIIFQQYFSYFSFFQLKSRHFCSVFICLFGAF